MNSVAAITQNDDISRAIQECLDLLPLEDLFNGKLVAIKPNDTYASKEDTTAVTQADSLRAVVQYVKRHNPRRLVVTGGAGASQTDEVFRVTGMMDVIEEERVEFFDHNRKPFIEVDLEHGPQRKVVVNPFVTEIETLVSLAQLKLHETATVTLSMKNIAMSFPAADYYGHPRSREWHRNEFFDDMHGLIVGMVKRFPIQLAIIVGHPAMIVTGPLGGKPVETGLVIASRDFVAADSVGARLLGFHAQAVRHIFDAGRVGLGQPDLEQVEIKGLSIDDAVRIFTEKAYGSPMDFEHP